MSSGSCIYSQYPTWGIAEQGAEASQKKYRHSHVGARRARSKAMRWTSGGDSSDFGGFNGMHLGIGGTLVLIVLSFLFRTNLFSVLGGGGTAAPSAAVRPLSNPDADPAEKREVEFVTFVINDVQHTWEQLLPKAGTPYRHTKLVLFRDLTQSGCGTAQTATGPFYCPEDEKVYIDLGFFQELRDRFGAPGEFAQAYVLAHEVGHHVTETARHRGQDATALAQRSGAGEPAFGPTGT